ncbi:helix-turn-helix domain-containing protein [Bacillus cereus]|uniref:helix-turn-helix domain-containing protein n=1 Tax=Bacillus cereus TaxID=1396 RepID=UPI003D184E91
MVTDFGKFCKKLREENDEFIKDMANKLDVSCVYLSGVENGRNKIPKDWLEKLTDLYQLDGVQQEELQVSIIKSLGIKELDIKGLTGEDIRIILSLSQKIGVLSDADKDLIKNVVGKYEVLNK